MFFQKHQLEIGIHFNKKCLSVVTVRPLNKLNLKLETCPMWRIMVQLGQKWILEPLFSEI